MALNTKAVVDELDSICAATGLFRQTITFEPKRAPDAELAAATWFVRYRPGGGASGLTATSAVLDFNTRLYTNMLQEPPGAIDPSLVIALDTVLTSIHADLTLGGNVRNVDVFGETGQPMDATSGYLDIDGTMFRVVDIRIPCIINDAWAQTA